MKNVLVFAALCEMLTGVLLLISPSFVAGLLLGDDLTGSAVTMGRVAGVALIGLGVSCWPGPASLGMLIYGLLITLFFAWLGTTQAATGPLLWPTVVLHAILTALLIPVVMQLLRSRKE